MKPAAFAYRRADGLDAALGVLREHGGDAKLLAGGQSLIPMLNLRLSRPAVLLDVNRVGLDRVARHDGMFRLDALVRHRVLEEHPELIAEAPLLVAAAPLIGHRPIRMRGTIGGSLAHADPAAELPTVVLALDGILHVASAGGGRTVSAHDFFRGPFMTALDEDEMVIAVDIPVHGNDACAYEELAIRAGDFAVVGVAAAVRFAADGVVESARIAIAGAAGAPVRASGSEDAIAGRRLDETTLRDAGEQAKAAIDPTSDVHGSREYRRSLAAELVARALMSAARKAGHA